jgi:NCAIR mutase (PurE)-related protein
MDINDLKHLLTAVQTGDLSIDEGLERLRKLPFEDTGIAMIDHHRALRQGVPEVVLGEAKSAEQIAIIVERMVAHGDNILVTRISSEKAEPLSNNHPDGEYDPISNTYTLQQNTIRSPILTPCNRNPRRISAAEKSSSSVPEPPTCQSPKKPQ